MTASDWSPLCSIGPVMAVLILGLLFEPQGAYGLTGLVEAEDSVELGWMFLREFPEYMKEIAGALLPIIAFFGVFQVVSLRIGKKGLLRIIVGLVYTYVGLVLFLTGVNVGFMPVGTQLGRTIASLPYRWVIVPIGMVIGYFIVMAEPGGPCADAAGRGDHVWGGFCKGDGIQPFIWRRAFARPCDDPVLTGISILWFLIPGYAIAITLSFFVPKIFTAIAFDSGGVASGR